MEDALMRDRFLAMLRLQEVAGSHSRPQPVSCHVDPCQRLRQRSGAVTLSTNMAPTALVGVQRLLEWSYGYTERAAGCRRAPSAGALFPTETYVLGYAGAQPVALYYCFKTHTYYHLEQADPGGILTECGVAPGEMLVMLASVLWRTVQRYGVRGYRYCLLDAAVVAHNMREALMALKAGQALELLPPTRRTEEKLALSNGEVCVMALKLSHAAVATLTDAPDPPSRGHGLESEHAETPPVLSPALMRARTFHSRSLAAAGA
jgi:hypothetical protein